jgi:hypothetical protein
MQASWQGPGEESEKVVGVGRFPFLWGFGFGVGVRGGLGRAFWAAWSHWRAL